MADRRSGDNGWKSATGGSNTGEARSRLVVRTPCIKCGVRCGAIEGLGGFVGVDFIWDEQRRHATILEINPRPDDITGGALPALAGGPPGSGPGSRRFDRRIETTSCSKVCSAWYIPKNAVVFDADGEFADLLESSRSMSNALVRDHGPLVALDIGGANIKVAHSYGQALTIPVRGLEAA